MSFYRFAFPLICCLVNLVFAQSDYRAMHESSLVIDLHNDAILDHLHGRSLEKLNSEGHIDLPRLKTGGVDAPFFALWPDSRKINQAGMYHQTVRMLDSLLAIISRNPQTTGLARSPEEILNLTQQGKAAICIGIEGGLAIENSLDKLDYFYNRGVRYLGLTWNENTEWATAARAVRIIAMPGFTGLSEFGKEVVRRMNQLGMIIDLAHASEQTFYDALNTSVKPVIVSHAAVAGICPHYRNLTDAQLKALAKNGGVIGITFYPGYLVKGLDLRIQKLRKHTEASGDFGAFDLPSYLRKELAPDYPSVKNIADHIEYVIRLVGEDYVAIGSDFDGVSLLPDSLEDVTRMPEITRELLGRGYGENTIRKIWGENIMRVFSEVQRTAAKR
jgi:membrane dipeptidase